MKIHHALPADPAYRAERERHPLVVAIGFFDGFHLGHRAIVRELHAIRQPGERAAVLTFRNHPSSFLRPGTEPPQISTLEERVNAFARAGIDEAFVLPFDAAIAALGPAAFLDDMLIGKIGARAMVVGANFRFGAKRAGEVTFAKRHLEDRGLRFAVVGNTLDSGERVSSTRVRAAIGGADLATADRLLGASYMVRGRVSMGFGRGHDLGFPTANIVVAPEKMLPPDGVYRVVGRHDGRDYAGLVSIGTNPTFGGTERTVEAWLLDFNGSLYGEELALREFRFVRGQQRFQTVDALLAQMRADAATVRFPSFR
ncbi:MAG: bifunctional riboflavin kinase/FAD synthetase [Candidatus Velthaea sp.]